VRAYTAVRRSFVASLVAVSFDIFVVIAAAAATVNTAVSLRRLENDNM